MKTSRSETETAASKSGASPRKISNKVFAVLCLLIVLSPVAFKLVRHQILSDQYLKKLVIVEAEKSADLNIQPPVSRLSKNSVYFGGQALELDTPNTVEGGYFIRFTFDVPEDGDYGIFVAGTPPGPAVVGSEWQSPYAISIDGSDARLLTEEGLKTEWPYVFQHSYAKGGYYFTKVGAEHLAKGTHTITFTVNQKRRHDGNYTVYLDALILSPADFRPQTNVGKIPKALFYD